MKCEVEQIDPKREEHVMVYCHNREASWVQNVREAVFGQSSVCGYKNPPPRGNTHERGK